MTQRMQIALALIVGACAGSSTPLVAEPGPQTAPASVPTPAAPATHTSVTTLEAAERRAAPNGKAAVSILARGEEAFVGRLELDGLVEIPPHRDETEEFIVVLEGGGTILIDGRAHQLGVGSAVYMPANAEVSYANGPSKLVALQVFAGPGPASKYDKWAPVD